MSALAETVPGSLGLGLAYVFGMVFPLLIAVLFWDRLELSRRYARLPRLPRLRLGDRRLPWSDAVAAAMFLAIGGLALYIAYTGQTTYLPDWLAAWNRSATGLTGDLAAALRGLPVIAQAAALAVLAAGIGWGVFQAWTAEPTARSTSEMSTTSDRAASSRR